jgi:ABC-2 type transport system permease protein
MSRVLPSVFRKEMLHILRDPQSLFMVLTMPLLMLFLYGYAITLDMRSIDTAVLDESRSPESRELIEKLSSTPFFRLTGATVPDGQELFQSRRARCLLIIPRDYAQVLASGREAQVQLLIDASDPNAANFINAYLGRVAAGESGPGLFAVEPRLLYNPDLRSANFFVPGIIALILILISTLLTSIAIAREKETGTMEQLLVSPIKPGQLILGKVLPYVAIGFVDGLLILLAGSLWFRVPIRGSLALVMAMMLIYVLTGISLGILVSTVADSQAVAMLATVTLTVLPSMLMSGFIFPVASMPRLFQWLSAVVPATYFLQIIRGIILKGNTLANLYPQAAVLLGMDLLLILASMRAFRSRLE